MLLRHFRHLSEAVAGMLMASSAVLVAAAQYEDPWYLGVGIHRSRLGLHGTDFDRGFAWQGITTTTSVDDEHTDWNLQAGYRFGSSFALEGGYMALGRYKYGSVARLPGADVVQGTLKAHAWWLAPVGLIPLGNHWSALGKMGITRVSSDLTASSTTGATAPTGDSHDNTGWLIGLGTNYDMSPSAFLRLEWNRFGRVGDPSCTGRGDVDQLGASLGLRF